jgi:PTS system nitrogen regulatory IIA component
MNLISTLLRPAHVALDVEAGNKKALFERAAGMLEGVSGLTRAQVTDSLLARERLGSTGLGQGIAIPHGRVKGLREAVCAFLRLSAPIPFDAPDSRPVSLIFVLLVPERATDDTCKILSNWRRCSAIVSFALSSRSAGCARRTASDRRLAGARAEYEAHNRPCRRPPSPSCSRTIAKR